MATYYFSPVGNDSTGNGTQGNPWQTISKAYTASAASDALLADSAHGNHTWSSQTFSSARTLGSYGGGTAVFDGGGANTIAWYAQAAVVTASNLTWQNAAQGVDRGLFNSSVSTGGTFNFINCIFSGLNCGSGSGGNHGIFASGTGNNNQPAVFNLTSCLVENCTGASGASIWVNGAGPLTINTLNCILYSNTTAIATANIINDGSGFGAGAAVSATFTNTIIFDAANNGNAFNTNGGNTTYSGSNNDFKGYTSVPSLTGNISSDPLFVDAANGNFNLRPTSPCIDAGTAI